MIRGIALIAFGAGLAWASAADAAPIQWTGPGSNGHYYEYITSNPTDWLGAKSSAEAMTFGGSTGHLATSTSAEENAFITSLLNTAGGVYLGGTDAGTEGSFRWVTGEPFSFTHWATGEPNGGTFQNFLQIFGALGSAPGTWIDVPGNTSNYVVEFDTVAQTPVPAALPLFGTALVGLGILSRRRKRAVTASRVA